MTIIEPNKNRFHLSLLMTLAISFVILGAILSIFAYSQSVRLHHLLDEQQVLIDDLQVQTADLKNRLYTLLDFGNVDQLAEQLGLIKERKPEYLARQ